MTNGNVIARTTAVCTSYFILFALGSIWLGGCFGAPSEVLFVAFTLTAARLLVQYCIIQVVE